MKNLFVEKFSFGKPKKNIRPNATFSGRNHLARFACLSLFILLFCSTLDAQVLSKTASKAAMAYLNQIRANPQGHSGDGKFKVGDGNLDWHSAIRVNLQGVAPRSPLYWHDGLFTLCENKANAMADLCMDKGDVLIQHVFTGTVPSSLPQWEKDYLTNGILKFAADVNYRVRPDWQNQYVGENLASYNEGLDYLGKNPSEEAVAKGLIRQLINDYNFHHDSVQAGHRRAVLGMNKGYRDPIHFAMAIRKFTINKPGSNFNGATLYIGVAMVARPGHSLRVENFDLITTATAQPSCWLMTEWTGDQVNKGPNGKYEQCMSTKDPLQPNASGGNLFELTDRWNNDRHRWTLQKAGNGYYQLVNEADSTKCLAFDSNGAGVLKAKETQDDHQLWSFKRVDEIVGVLPSHRYYIVNKSNGMVLTSDFNAAPEMRLTGNWWDIYCDNPVMNGPLTN